MARSLTVTWVLPTTRESGKPLNPADIAAVELALSADGGVNYSPYGAYTPDVLSTVIPELEAGEWTVAGTVKDTAGRLSKVVTASVVVPDDTAPGALTSLTLTF